MGWMSESDDHEGYLRGFEPLDPGYSVDQCLREITSSDSDKRTIPLRWICSACECGWRSPRWRARTRWHEQDAHPPFKVHHYEPEWSPCIVNASPEDEEIGRILFREHDRSRPVERIDAARLLAKARLGWPADGARVLIVGEKDDHPRKARVLSSHMADRAGRNLHVRLDEGEVSDGANPTTRGREAWIRSSAIVELL